VYTLAHADAPIASTARAAKASTYCVLRFMF
jgi:hypothetical protein